MIKSISLIFLSIVLFSGCASYKENQAKGDELQKQRTEMAQQKQELDERTQQLAKQQQELDEQKQQLANQ